MLKKTKKMETKKSVEIIKKLLKLGEKEEVESQEFQLILNFLLKRINISQIKDTITFDLDGTVMLRGNKLDTEQSIKLKESAMALDTNFARRFVEDQLEYEMIKTGIHSSLNMEVILMAKAAIWIHEQEKRLISQIAGVV